MKKLNIIFLLSIFIFSGVNTYAKSRSSSMLSPQAERLIVWGGLSKKGVQDVLKLTFQQKEKISKIIRKYRGELEKVRIAYDRDKRLLKAMFDEGSQEYVKKAVAIRKQMRSRSNSLQAEKIKQICRVLSSDQIKKLEEIAQDPSRYLKP